MLIMLWLVCCCVYILGFLIVDDTRRNHFICVCAHSFSHSQSRKIACNVFKVSATMPLTLMMAHDHNLNYKFFFALFIFRFEVLNVRRINTIVVFVFKRLPNKMVRLCDCQTVIQTLNFAISYWHLNSELIFESRRCS